MGNYSGARKIHLTSRDYLESLDEKLSFPQGTLFNLCVTAIKSKVETKDGIVVTYRGMTTRQKRLSTHRYIQLNKAIFLIEFNILKKGNQYTRVVQVHLEMQ